MREPNDRLANAVSAYLHDDAERERLAGMIAAGELEKAELSMVETICAEQLHELRLEMDSLLDELLRFLRSKSARTGERIAA